MLVVQLSAFAFGYGILWTEVRHLRALVNELRDLISKRVLEHMGERQLEHEARIRRLEERCEREHG